MIEFSHQCPPRLIFGWGSAARLGQEAARLGRKPLVVTGRSLRTAGRLEPLLDDMRGQGLAPLLFEGVPAEPGLEVLQACMDAARAADSVIAIGGGSVLDIAKGAAALAPTVGTPGPSARDYFSGTAVPESGRPILAVPTTSGTGSEMTWVCVLVDAGARRKASIRGPAMMPAVALVDPELTVSCPRSVTAWSGMDAFVQAVEAYVSKGATPFTDALALEAALLTARALETAVREPAHCEARERMALGSMMAGTALNTSRLGLVHGIAHPVGAVTGAAHGLLCGLLMPAVMRFNQTAAAPRYAHLARELDLVDRAAPDDVGFAALLAFTEDLLDRVEIPRTLRKVGFNTADLDWIAQETLPSGSTRANPRAVSLEDAYAVTADAL